MAIKHLINPHVSNTYHRIKHQFTHVKSGCVENGPKRPTLSNLVGNFSGNVIVQLLPVILESRRKLSSGLEKQHFGDLINMNESVSRNVSMKDECGKKWGLHSIFSCWIPAGWRHQSTSSLFASVLDNQKEQTVRTLNHFLLCWFHLANLGWMLAFVRTFRPKRFCSSPAANLQLGPLRDWNPSPNPRTRFFRGLIV